MKRLILRALETACDLCHDWAPWGCALTDFSIRLDQRWCTGYWVDPDSPTPRRIAAATGRKCATVHLSGPDRKKIGKVDLGKFAL